MSNYFEIELNLSSPDKMLGKLGINENGAAQRFFANELMKLSFSYMPFDSGMLQNSARLSNQGDAIIYDTPYARMMWYGKVMIDPALNAAGFYIPNVGWRSRKNVHKVVSNRDIKYQGAPRRGAFWLTRCFLDNRQALTNATAKYIEEYSK